MISVVIPNFNGERLLKRNVPRLLELLKKSRLKHELIIVDDASTDESLDVLASLARGTLAKVKIIRRDKNEGFPTSADQGVRAARGEVVFVIKNDAVPEKADFFKLMLAHFKDPKVFAVSSASKTVEKGPPSFADGELRRGKERVEIRGCGVIYYEKGFFLHKRGSNSSPISAWADGSSSAFRKDLYLKLGGFDPIFNPGYWEDVDLGYRAWKAGYRVEFEPRAVLLHDFEQSVFRKKYGAEKLRLISLRNQFNFLWCNADVKHLILYLLWLPYHYLVSIKNGDLSFIKAHLLSEAQSISLLVARFKRKWVVKPSDDEVLSKFASI